MGSGILSVFEFQDGLVHKNGKSGSLEYLNIDGEREPVLMVAQAESIPKFHYPSRRCGSCSRALKGCSMIIVTPPFFVSACLHCEAWNYFPNGKKFWLDNSKLLSLMEEE